MSSVRMCDKYGTIFSENEEDWSTFTGTAKRRREDGSRYTESITQDACAACTGGGGGAVSPRLAVGGASFPDPVASDPGHYDPARTAALENELGMSPGLDMTPGFRDGRL